LTIVCTGVIVVMETSLLKSAVIVRNGTFTSYGILPLSVKF
jgi:hypothetical protein